MARLDLHDRRGVGLSSRDVPPPHLETRVSDLLAVLDTVGADRPVLAGDREGGSPNVLLAATQPERVRSLIWYAPSPRSVWTPDYPWGVRPEYVEREVENLATWGTPGWACIHRYRVVGGPRTGSRDGRGDRQVQPTHRDPQRRDAARPDLARERCPRRPARGARTHADPPVRASRSRTRRVDPRGIAHPRGRARRLARERGRRRRPAPAGGDPRVPRAGPSAGARHDPVHRAVHRHRRDRPSDRRAWATQPGRNSSEHHTRSSATRWSAGMARRTTPPATASTPRSTARLARPMCAGDRPAGAATRDRDPRRYTHGRVRGQRRQVRRPHCVDRRTSGSARRSLGRARLTNREGSGRGQPVSRSSTPANTSSRASPTDGGSIRSLDDDARDPLHDARRWTARLSGAGRGTDRSAVRQRLVHRPRAPVGRAGDRRVPRAARVVLPADPGRQARHGAIGARRARCVPGDGRARRRSRGGA